MPQARLGFLAFALVATAVACTAQRSESSLPWSGPAFVRSGGATPTASPPLHAACAMPAGITAPLAGTLVVDTAFGQLEESGGVRYASRGVDLSTKKGQVVRAAQSGVARYAKLKPGYQSAIVTAPDGSQTLYEPLQDKHGNGSPFKKRTIKAGEAIGNAGSTTLHFELTDDAGFAGGAAAQLNPCGSSNGAAGTISTLPVSAFVNVNFATFSLDGTPFPSTSPGPSGGVTTPVAIAAANVIKPHTWSFEPYQYGVSEGTYYVVLCGNAVFATGANARYVGPFPAPNTSSSPIPLPSVVFFRDPGTQGASLTESLPANSVYPHACPAPPPPSGTFYNWVLTLGQSVFGFWLGSSTGQTVAMTVANPAVASVAPSNAPVVTATPSYPPPAGTYFTITAEGVGQTQITNTSNGVTLSPVAVTVLATPSPAPVPTPMSNATASPTASPSASPSTSPSASPTASPTPKAASHRS